MNELALCAGIGGLSLGLREAIPSLRTVCYVEREAYAAAVLVRQMQAQRLDRAPIWSDLRTFNARVWRGSVDLITAGFPCQPHSVAGKRRGHEDDRWLFDDIARIVREAGPRYVFLENVPGLVSSGLDRVLCTLAGLGYDAEWSVFSAAEVGAHHLRKRLFILAAHAGRSRSPIGQGAQAERPHATTPRGHGWTTEPTMDRGNHALPNRVDRLRALGNAVVPATASLAWRILAGRFSHTFTEDIER